MLIGRDDSALHREGRLDQTRDAGSRLEMTEVGLGGADQQRCFRQSPASVDGAESAGLDGIAEEGPGAVRLDVVDRHRVDAGVGTGGPQHGGLRGRVGCHQSVGATVLIDRRSADEGENLITVSQRIGESLEDDDSAAFAAHESVSGRVEGVTCAGGRHRLGLIEAARHHR